MNLMVLIRKIYKGIYGYVTARWHLASGQRSLGRGYWEYRKKEIARICADNSLLDTFLNAQPLPGGYGIKLDERTVEYPWVLSRIKTKPSGMLLDAGSVLNFDFVLSNPILTNRTIYIYNLAPEEVIERPNVSYIYGDLRSTAFKDGFFDEIVCISTLEHIGMDNTFLYSQDQKFKESAGGDYLKVILEFERILKPGGRLLITVPFGAYEHLNWLQQFNMEMINSVIKTFQGKSASVVYYQYSTSGWRLSNAQECAGCRYFDIHVHKKLDPQRPVAAAAVACLELIK